MNLEWQRVSAKIGNSMRSWKDRNWTNLPKGKWCISLNPDEIFPRIVGVFPTVLRVSVVALVKYDAK